jgi:hypothetical protein
MPCPTWCSRRLAAIASGRGRRRPWLTRRWTLVPTVAAGVLTAVLLAAAVLLARDGRAPTTPTTPAVLPAANQAVRIDPATFRTAP